MTPIHIRVATPTDAAALSDFAARTFAATFGADNSPDDMATYIGATFTPDLQAAELGSTNGVILLVAPAEGSGADDLIAYAALGSGDTPPCVTGQPTIELKRFYVVSAWQGRGVAQALMQRALLEVSQRGARTLWLGVWERNARAIAFYHKCGFRRVGDQPFQLGTDLQTDCIMQRPVETALHAVLQSDEHL
ncbi:MAG: GNAT family N-acetyltransferase [Gemmatimonadaceae bacterium]